MIRFVEHEVLERCLAVLPGWQALTVDDVDFDPPKGFSSFTMGVRPRPAVDPPAVLYRHLAGKENAILDAHLERDVFLLLGDHGIAAHCYHADDTCRIESFHVGRTLRRDEVLDPEIQHGIAGELWRLHQLEPAGLPDEHFFARLHRTWADLGRPTLTERRHELPVEEQRLCDELLHLYEPATLTKAMAHLPDRPMVFCHNDTYHGNVMRLHDGSIKLVDFEFSCRGHESFDIANLFAETVMRHGDADPPHFHIAEPEFDDDDIRRFVTAYLSHETFDTDADRAAATDRLVAETRRAIPLSDLMYATAAIPLALEPIQRIRFIPYAHERFHRFLAATVD